jgi:hypothetical protein
LAEIKAFSAQRDETGRFSHPKTVQNLDDFDPAGTSPVDEIVFGVSALC